MKKYELTCIINAELSDAELGTTTKKIIGFITEEEGKIDKELAPQKRGLKYPIHNKSDSFLFSVDFTLSPEKIEGLNKKMKLETQILRFMISQKIKISDMPIRRRKKNVVPKQEKEKEITHFAEKNKVDINEIDKKIDEILSE